MRRVGLVDITVGNAARLGASQRSTTRRCASHHIATQRASRWDIPAALARLARTVRLKRPIIDANRRPPMKRHIGASPIIEYPTRSVGSVADVASLLGRRDSLVR